MQIDENGAAALAAAITRLVPRLVASATGIADLRRLTGGASLQTWAFDAIGAGRVVPLILRRRGAGDRDIFETSLSLATEATVIAAAERAGAPVAPLVHLCAEDDGLGEAYVVRRVAGEALGRRIAADPAFAPARRKLSRQCGEALARIHRTDTTALANLAVFDGLGMLAIYRRLWQQSGAMRPTIETAFRWLERSPPPAVAPVLVHGDFRNGNLMVDPERGLVAALDWEMAHLGDPADDFGWLCVNSWRFGCTDRAVGGFGTHDDLLGGYADAGGTPPPRASILWWQMAGSLKWAVIATLMYQTFARGETASVERALIGRRVSECEVDLLALMEAV